MFAPKSHSFNGAALYQMVCIETSPHCGNFGFSRFRRGAKAFEPIGGRGVGGVEGEELFKSDDGVLSGRLRRE